MVAVSGGAAQMASAVLGVPEDNISVIYNPAGTVRNLDRLVKEAPDHPWFRDGGPPVVLGAGRLVRQKDFGVLIEAFHRVQSEYPSRLVILGEGERRNELEGMVRARGLEDRVSLPGWAENPFAYMARAALFVLSSRYEGFGIVLVEAMACGCPAVSTDCPAGPAEILEDPRLLAPVGDPEALARTMLREVSKPADKAAGPPGFRWSAPSRATSGSSPENPCGPPTGPDKGDDAPAAKAARRGLPRRPAFPHRVMPGLVPGIHALRHRGARRQRAGRRRDVDARTCSIAVRLRFRGRLRAHERGRPFPPVVTPDLIRGPGKPGEGGACGSGPRIKSGVTTGGKGRWARSESAAAGHALPRPLPRAGGEKVRRDGQVRPLSPVGRGSG